MFTMFYNTTVNTSQRVSSNVYYRLCSKHPPFALMQAVRRRRHWSMAVSTMCCSRSFQTPTSSWARLLFKHLSLKSLWIMRLTNVRGILSSLEICLVDRCVWNLSSWLWTSSSTAAMLSAVWTDCGRPLPCSCAFDRTSCWHLAAFEENYQACVFSNSWWEILLSVVPQIFN